MRFIKVFLGLILFLITIFYLHSRFIGKSKLNSIDIGQISDTLELSKKWMLNNQKENGLFNYTYWPRLDKFSADKDDNIVRQIGSFYSLIRIYEVDRDDRILKSLEKFRKKIEEYILFDNIKGEDIAYIEYNGLSKINANALYILSLATLAKNNIPLTDSEDLNAKKILKGIELMENPDGGFWYIYYLPDKDNKISVYGTGEVLYSLVSYYKYVDQDPGLLSLSQKHFDLLYTKSLGVENFTDEDSRSFYSWVLDYLAELNTIEPGQYKYAKTMINRMFLYREQRKECRDNGCVNIPNNIVESTYLEGLSAVYPLLIASGDTETLTKVNNFLFKQSKMLIGLQIKNVEDYTAKSGQTFIGDKKNIVGAFCSRLECDELRNDYNQHISVGLANLIISQDRGY